MINNFPAAERSLVSDDVVAVGAVVVLDLEVVREVHEGDAWEHAGN